MMSKGIAIRSILLFVIGILVAVVLIYIFLTYISGGTLSLEECRVVITNTCNMCKIANWDSSISLSQEVRDCGKGGDWQKTQYWAFYDNDHCGDFMDVDCRAIGLG